MRRRDFIKAAVGAASTWPLAASAQQPKTATVGVLVTGNPNPEAFLQEFRSALAAAGLINEADPFAAPFAAQLGQSARSIGVQIEPILVHPDAPQTPAFAAMVAKRVDAFIVELGTIRPETAELAIEHRLPSSGPRAWPSTGGLIGYSGNLAEMTRLAADYVDKIIKGRKPADLPVALPTKFDLAVNVKTAKALGLEVPPMLLARADEVIE